MAQKFNITSSVGIPMQGGIMSPANSIFEVQIMGVQYAYGDFPEAIGWNAKSFKDQASADADNPLMCKRQEEAGNVGHGGDGCSFGGMIPTSSFTFETGTDGALTQASIDSLKAVLIPMIAPEFDGIETGDLS